MKPIYITESTFSRQSKQLKKVLTHYKLSLAQARNLLAQVYGFAHDYDYRKHIQHHTEHESAQILVQQSYAELVQRLSTLGQIDSQVAKHAIKVLWPDYLDKSYDNWHQHHASFSFDPRLQHFLKPPQLLQQDYAYDGKPALKDAIEAQGVPHTEIALIVHNGQIISDDTLLLADGHYQVFAPGSYYQQQLLSPQVPTQGIRFLLDINLGKLARHLRMLGFDSLLPKDNIDDDYLANLGAQQQRILLTRDKGLLKRSVVNYGYWVRSQHPKQQLQEILDYYALHTQCKHFSRCINCNGQLQPIEKQQIISQLPEQVIAQYHEFKQCGTCSQLYWPGTHVDKMRDLIQQVGG